MKGNPQSGKLSILQPVQKPARAYVWGKNAEVINLKMLWFSESYYSFSGVRFFKLAAGTHAP